MRTVYKCWLLVVLGLLLVLQYVPVCVCVCVLGFGLCQSYASVYAVPVVGAYFARVCARVVLLAASGELPAGTSLS